MIVTLRCLDTSRLDRLEKFLRHNGYFCFPRWRIETFLFVTHNSFLKVFVRDKNKKKFWDEVEEFEKHEES